jgi:hypothetical protein
MNVYVQLNQTIKCYGEVIPTGTQTVPLETILNITVIISPSVMPGDCTLCSVIVDTVPNMFTCPPPGGSHTHSLEVEGDHNVLVEIM